MSSTTLLVYVALLLGALAILPGALGVVAVTHKFAATAMGARIIYRYSRWLLLGSVLLMAGTLVSTLQQQAATLPFAAAVLVYMGLLVFGFLMHVGLNFKPVRKPTFITMNQAIDQFGPDEEVVGVLDVAGNAFAFVTRLARRPHVIYQPDGNTPFIMTHCILAHSSMSYAMTGEFSDPDIMVVAVIANNMVFYDKTTRCSVIQIENQARKGQLNLKPLSTVAVKLKTWQQLYPRSPVWLRQKEWRDTFYLKLLSRADVIDPQSPAMIYATEHELDKRLPMKSQVVGVEFDGTSCAYPVDGFSNVRVINDQLGARRILVAAACNADYIQVFDREIEPGRVLEFASFGDSRHFRDKQTGSLWGPTGECTRGELFGRQLAIIPHYNKIFWYVWADFHEGTKVYVPGQETAAEGQ